MAVKLAAAADGGGAGKAERLEISGRLLVCP